MSTNEVTTGSVVNYSDMMNDSTFVVVEVNESDPWSTFKLRNVETFEMETTDGQQSGWKVLVK